MCFIDNIDGLSKFKGSSAHQAEPTISQKMRPKDRKLFIELSRNVELERERFREMFNRMMNSMVRTHNTENEMYKIESEGYIDLQIKFGRAESKLDRMRDHTVGMVNDLIALT